MICYLWRNSVRTVIDLSAPTFILLIEKKKKKPSHSSVCYLGMINTFHVLSPIMLNLFSIPAWDRKYIFDLFFSTLWSSLLCDFMHFIPLGILPALLELLTILTQKAHNTSKHNSDLKFNHNTCHKIIVAPNELCKVFLYVHHLIQSFCTLPIKINWNN